MSTVIEPPVTPVEKHHEEVETVTIRFAGDSGDGMQLTGTQFTNTSAVVGNDISTLPDFPAEIRAPAGSLPGVSGFQLNFSSQDIKTPGDQPNVLVAMNRLRSDPARHSAAARALAAEWFDSDRVLTRLLDAVGVT